MRWYFNILIGMVFLLACAGYQGHRLHGDKVRYTIQYVDGRVEEVSRVYMGRTMFISIETDTSTVYVPVMQVKCITRNR